MSRGFVKEGDQEEIPMVLPRAFLPSGIPNYVTPEGLKLLHEEMETLKNERVEAGSNYITKNYIDAKMRLLSERINNAVLIDPAKANPDVVSFGMYVRYNDKVIRIVGVDEADASKGLVSFISPIAKALIGKKKGDKLEIKVPRGTEVVEVQDVMRTYLIHNEKKIKIKDIERKVEDKTHRKEVHKYEINDSKNLDDSDSQVQRLPDSKEEIFVPETNPTDFLPLVNERGHIIGRALYCEIHNANKLLHPAVHLLVYNSKKEIVAKYWWHVAFGETPEKTLKRKMKENEINNLKPKYKKQYIRKDKNENELVSVFTAVFDGDVLISPDNKDYDKIFEESIV